MIPKEIINLIKWKTYPEMDPRFGGQSVGRIITGVTLVCKDAGFEISIDNYRSQLKNKELCMTLFELYLQEIETI